MSTFDTQKHGCHQRYGWHPDAASLKDSVKQHYGQAAQRVRDGQAATCDGSEFHGSCCGPSPTTVQIGSITGNLYAADAGVGSAGRSAAGLAGLRQSHGAGRAARRRDRARPGFGRRHRRVPVGPARRAPTGKAYGLDMTDEMLELARENQRKAGVANVEFLKGEMEDIPLPDQAVDVVISNCVINLSADKGRVLARGFPRAAAGRPPGGVRHRGARRGARRDPRATSSLDGLRGRGAGGIRLSRQACRRRLHATSRSSRPASTRPTTPAIS